MCSELIDTLEILCYIGVADLQHECQKWHGQPLWQIMEGAGPTAIDEAESGEDQAGSTGQEGESGGGDWAWSTE